MSENVVTYEAAVSGRSRCRATGDVIQKGDRRVGLKAWVAGRNTMTWQKPVPFLECCAVEECGRGNVGACKQTGVKFQKGDMRVTVKSGTAKTFLSLQAAAEQLKPIVKDAKFDVSKFHGYDSLSPDYQLQLCHLFGQQSPPPNKATGRSRDKAGKENKEKQTQEEQPRRQSSRNHTVANAPQCNPVVDLLIDKQKAVDENKDDAEVAQEVQGVSSEVDRAEDDQDEDDGLSEYERIRLQRIAANKARLMELELPALANQLAQDVAAARRKSAPKAKPSAAKKRAPPTDLVPRRSLRQRGVKAEEGGVTDEQLVDVQVDAWRHTERHHKGDIEVDTADHGSMAVLQAVKATGQDNSDGSAVGAADRPKASQLAQLSLREEDVEKVSSRGITHCTFHPTTSHLLVASGDKEGNVSVWRVSDRTVSRGDGSADMLEASAHRQYVSGVSWCGVNVMSCSYDGSLRLLDVAAQKWVLKFSDEDEEYSALETIEDGSVAYLATPEGTVRRVDTRESPSSSDDPVELSHKKLNSLSLNRCGWRLVSGAGDGAVALWDLRTFGKKMKRLGEGRHSATCQSAYFAPDGSGRVVSTSRDNSVRVWDCSNGVEQVMYIRHNNNTGRWISPFRSVWGPAADCVIIGGMGRTVDILEVGGGQPSVLAALQNDLLSAIPSRIAVHPGLPCVAGGTASGRLHIFR